MRDPLPWAEGQRANYWATCWAGFAALVCGAVSIFEPVWLEEGMLVHISERLASGDVLYRDVSAFTGPFPYELLALLFRVFGPELWVARAAVVVLQSLACASAFGLGNQLGNATLGHGAALVVALSPLLFFPFLSIFYYVTVAVALTLMATYASVRGQESFVWAGLSALLVVSVALSKQTLGLALAVTISLAWALMAVRDRRLAPLLVFWSIAALASMGVIGLYIVRGEFDLLVKSLVEIPLSLGEDFQVSWINFWPLGELNLERGGELLYLPWIYGTTFNFFSDPPAGLILLTQGLFALPFFAIGVALIQAVAGRMTRVGWMVFAALVATMTNLYPRPDWGHLVFVLPLSLMLLWLIVGRAPESSTKFLAGWMGLVWLAIPLLVISGWMAVLILRAAIPADWGPRVPFWAVSHQNRSLALPRVIEFLRKRVSPGEYIFVARSEPLIYFATETQNPTPYSGVIPGGLGEQQPAVLKGLTLVDFVVMSEIDQPGYTYYREELPKVQRYLERNFEIADPFLESASDWIVVLERIEDRGPSLFDLADHQGEARRWMRQSGVEHEGPAPPKMATVHNRRPVAFYLGEGGGGIDFLLDLPQGAIFQSEVGFPSLKSETFLFEHPRKAEISVLVSLDGENFERLESWTIQSARGSILKEHHPMRRWRSIEADLSPYGGKRVTLRLEAASRSPGRPDMPAMSWFGSPRIIDSKKAGVEP